MRLRAGENDMALLAPTQVGRDINRQRFSRSGIDAALCKPVVAHLIDLIRLRDEHPVFGGCFELDPSEARTLVLRWTLDDGTLAELHADLGLVSGHIRTAEGGAQRISLHAGP